MSRRPRRNHTPWITLPGKEFDNLHGSGERDFRFTITLRCGQDGNFDGL
jgi:hypothetical protein